MRNVFYLCAFLLVFNVAVAQQSPFGKSQTNTQTEISFYPNPAKDVITFKYHSGKTIDIIVYNVLGSKVKTFTHNGSETNINISDLQRGLYFIRFTDGNNVVSKSFTKTD